MCIALFLLLMMSIVYTSCSPCDENKLSLNLKDKNFSRAPFPSWDKVWNCFCGLQAAPSSGPNSPPLSITTPHLVPPEPASQSDSPVWKPCSNGSR